MAKGASMRAIGGLFYLLFSSVQVSAAFGGTPFLSIRGQALGAEGAAPPAGVLAPVKYKRVQGPLDEQANSNLKDEQCADFIGRLSAMGKKAGLPEMTRNQERRLLLGLVTIDQRFVDPVSTERWEKIFWGMGFAAEEAFRRGSPGWDEVIDVVLKKAVKMLKEPHSDYLNPEEARIESDASSGKLRGIGVNVSPDPAGMALDIVYPGSPAERGGLLDGDVIVSVDGLSVAGMPISAIISKVRGPEGTTVRLGISRGGAPLGRVEVVRGVVEVPNAFSRMAAEKIGYVYLSQFRRSSPDEIVRLVEELRAQGALSLILDVRGNPGGYVSSVASIASEFLKDGDEIVSFRHQGKLDYKDVTDGNGKFAKVPVVVLVDAKSASASEILSGALQQKRRGVVVIGSRTFGKGTQQATIPQPGGRFLKLTENRWYTPDGRNICALPDSQTGAEIPGTGGIVPDLEVPVPEEQAKKVMREIWMDLFGKPVPGPRTQDPVLEKALQVLSGAEG
jgi:C-terminal peptidase prc